MLGITLRLPHLEHGTEADKGDVGGNIGVLFEDFGQDDSAFAVHRQRMRLGEQLRQILVLVRELVEGFETLVHLLDITAAAAVQCGYSEGWKENDEAGLAVGRERGAKGRRQRNCAPVV